MKSKSKMVPFSFQLDISKLEPKTQFLLLNFKPMIDHIYNMCREKKEIDFANSRGDFFDDLNTEIVLMYKKGKQDYANILYNLFKQCLVKIQKEITEKAIFNGVKNDRETLKRAEGLLSIENARLKKICELKKIPYLIITKERRKNLDEEKTSDEANKNPITQKLQWQGTPAEFGFIIDLLIQGNYLEKPTSSFLKDANFYLKHFNINTTVGTLSKEVSEKTNSISINNRNKIIIPHRDKLK